jgi:hypothetical protein
MVKVVASGSEEVFVVVWLREVEQVQAVVFEVRQAYKG